MKMIRFAMLALFLAVCADSQAPATPDTERLVGAWRLAVRLQDRIGNGVCQGWRDLLRPGDAIQRLLLVESGHFDRPFHRHAAAADRQAAIIGAVDGDHPQVELRGVDRIDFQFLFAGAFALFERRVIQERQPHRPLDLQGAVTAEKHHRGMGIDPLAAA